MVGIETLEELQGRRVKLTQDAGEHRAGRDEKNRKANEYASKRDELNQKTKELLEVAQENKKLREEHNHLVAENKIKRDELKEKADEIYSKVDSYQKNNKLGSYRSLKEIKKKIDRLEFRQQTNVLSVDKERAIVSLISELQEEFNRHKQQFEEDEELRKLLKEAQKYRGKASTYHDKVVEYANLAQSYHDTMIKTFKEVDKVRAEADAAHKRFVTAQKGADKLHHSFIKAQKEIRNFDKIIVILKRKAREAEKHKEKAETREKAEELFDQFRKGEKLSTGDILFLQRSKLL